MALGNSWTPEAKKVIHESHITKAVVAGFVKGQVVFMRGAGAAVGTRRERPGGESLFKTAESGAGRNC